MPATPTPERLYYTDAYATTFSARVLEALTHDDRPAVVLDRTAFYPTSGGQPFDTGSLDDVRVIEAIDLADGRVAHVLERPLSPGAIVEGRIDWPRRFDHMQQHTGQHVLSAAFEHLHGARTVSFHLGTGASTIDLAQSMTPDMVSAAEDEANRIVWEDRPVHVRFVSDEEAAALPLRKEPARTGTLRLVDVEGYDLSACGGTHVARTGGIGVVAIAGFERFKGGTRVEFVCGRRALARFRAFREAIAGAVRSVSVLPSELPAAIERLQQEARALKLEARSLQERLVAYEAGSLAERGERLEGIVAVLQVVAGWDAQGLKSLASAVAERPARVAVLLSDTTPAAIAVARRTGVPVDASALLRHLTARFGGKGGGRPDLAQGGGLAGASSEILGAAREWLTTAVATG